MRKNTKGFYTVEASIFLPFVLLAVLSLGYFIKVEGTWENCVHIAADECGYAAARSYSGYRYQATRKSIEERIADENPILDEVKVKGRGYLFQDGASDKLIAYRVEAVNRLDMPLGFGREFKLVHNIKYRGFVGKKYEGNPMGREALQQYTDGTTVMVFPQAGEKYHSEGCTYVKATVTRKILSGGLKKKYSPCPICSARSVKTGEVVFCFPDSGTAYHRGTCRVIKRQVIPMDKNEAVEKGYTPCSKCGGG